MHIVWSYILNLIVLIFLLNQAGSPPVRCFISWKAPVLLEARFLSWNSPNTVWWPGSARTRWGREGEEREGEKYQFLLPNRKIVPAPMRPVASVGGRQRLRSAHSRRSRRQPNCYAFVWWPVIRHSRTQSLESPSSRHSSEWLGHLL